MNSRTSAGKRFRIVIYPVIALALTLSVGSSVSAGSLTREAPRIVWDKDVELPLESVFEHDEHEILAASLQNDKITVNSINAGGIKKEKVSFPKYNIAYLVSFHHSQEGGYIAVGGNEILKVNEQGVKEWAYTLSLPSTYLVSVDQLADGSYIVAGTTPGAQGQGWDPILLKLSGSGTVIWQKTQSKPTEDSVTLVRHTEDGGFVLLGEESYAGSGVSKISMAKFTSTNKLEWEKSLVPSAVSDNLWNTALVQDKDGGYVITGFFNHPNPVNSIRNLTTGYILKTDAQGSLMWSHPLESTLDRSYANDVQLATGGGYIITGKANEDWHGTISKEFVQRLNNSGMVLWTKVIERTTENVNSGIVVNSSEEGYLVIGSADSEVKATRLNPQ
ncbi:hypothetical protein EJP77_00020 [Paenibacillus zeisoli]|uniref:WD40 repeat domain-containing protein n=1 Tax=Paenibacillus zeisoli TaxID=2496267 RepID=A0A433XNE3_9BACL|nr:PQQ-binding-like beta-propeller repeat protein [Paenibacillus zeisoli]RUT35458.1 hypothetical protein EJP77_00020 [Paenibacillus zeisoli]